VAVVELRNLKKSYQGQQVVRDLSLTMASGEILSLLGPSGCGKSTTLRMLAGLEASDHGEIRIGSRYVTNVPAAARKIGMVFQSLALFPHMSVAENIAFGLECKGVPAREQKPKIAAALSKVRLQGFEQRFPGQLSGGQRQRVALARAIVTDPELLLLDEPFSALDRKLRDEMQVELRQVIHELGITALFVTHDQEEAIRLSDRIAVMQGGQIVQIDVPRKIYEKPSTRFVAEFVGSPNLVPIQIQDGTPVLNQQVVEAEGLSAEATGSGSTHYLNVRPEHARLVAAHTPRAIKASVLSRVYEGAYTTYRVALSGHQDTTWVVRESVSESVTSHDAGASVFVTWNKQDAHIISETTRAGALAN
jgi:ABC-type Fe3+/spermidine/putrescine transport system ATPase subunit